MLAMLSIIAIHATEHQECFSRNNGYGFQRNHVSSELLVGGGGERTSRKDEWISEKSTLYLYDFWLNMTDLVQRPLWSESKGIQMARIQKDKEKVSTIF